MTEPFDPELTVDGIKYFEISDDGMVLCFNSDDELVISVDRGFIEAAYMALNN